MLWWASGGGTFVTIESSGAWAEEIRSTRMEADVDSRCTVVEVTSPSSAVRYLYYLPPQRFDVGDVGVEPRTDVADSLRNRLVDEGIVVWGNADRVEHTRGSQELDAQGFRRLDFDGLGPVSPCPWQTSVLGRCGVVAKGTRMKPGHPPA